MAVAANAPLAAAAAARANSVTASAMRDLFDSMAVSGRSRTDQRDTEAGHRWLWPGGKKSVRSSLAHRTARDRAIGQREVLRLRECGLGHGTNPLTRESAARKLVREIDAVLDRSESPTGPDHVGTPSHGRLGRAHGERRGRKGAHRALSHVRKSLAFPRVASGLRAAFESTGLGASVRTQEPHGPAGSPHL
jgi:hypothetical protein